MGLQYAAARAVSAVSTWGLKYVFRRPAANFPGKIALYLDPAVIAHARPKLAQGSVCVVGTNGKTTVTNLLADVLERTGQRVVCNRTGANLDSGVATSLLHAGHADWGVFECDELWLARILPHLQANYVVLLNLFRDQLDRVGEIERIQDSIVGALGSSPHTVLVYNADDPLCEMIAQRVAALPGREETRSIPFGVTANMGLAQNTVADATMCQRCSTMFEYAFRQYGQLGEYHCPNCGFSRPELAFAAEEVRLGADGLAFCLRESANNTDASSESRVISAPFSGAYMVYNLMAVAVAVELLGCRGPEVQRAIDEFDPRNGRLQTFDIAGRRVLLNLAKNPTGFNQNLKIVAQDEAFKVVAFFINDKEADGHDVSWLWDIDFEELSRSGQLKVYAAGIRGRDMQARLKYAGIASDVVESPGDLLGRMAALPLEVNAYLIANYTALPGVKAALEDAASSDAPGESVPSVVSAATSASSLAQATSGAGVGQVGDSNRASDASEVVGTNNEVAAATNTTAAIVGAADESPVVIAHLFPDLLNLYGDGGNVRVLEQRLRWRGIPVEVRRVHHGDNIDLSQVDLVMMGGSPDREQRLASVDLRRMRDSLHAYVEDDGPLLAICGSYQILGREWLLGDEIVEGLGLVDMTTRRPGTSADRLIDNIVLKSPLAKRPVVGYENHAGRTYLGAGVQAFGAVVSSSGKGNNDEDGQDGVLYRNVIGTYLHGPLLVKNPEVADVLLTRALERHAARTGSTAICLQPLDDSVEVAANEFMCARLGVR